MYWSITTVEDIFDEVLVPVAKVAYMGRQTQPIRPQTDYSPADHGTCTSFGGMLVRRSLKLACANPAPFLVLATLPTGTELFNQSLICSLSKGKAIFLDSRLRRFNV